MNSREQCGNIILTKWRDDNNGSFSLPSYYNVDHFWPRVKWALMSTIFGFDMADMIFLCNARSVG